MEDTRIIGCLLIPDLKYRRQQAAQGVLAGYAELHQAEQEVTQAVVWNYYTIIYAREQQNTVQELVDLIQTYRDQVDKIIANTGATKVDIIAFSMGSISSRYYLKNLGGTAKVDAWVSLAGPNHGTDAVENDQCNFTPCREIIPGSSFLAALNAIDETPGLVRYGTWRSPCDTTINPDESVILTGATNTMVGCIQHIQFLTDDPTYRQVRNFVQ